MEQATMSVCERCGKAVDEGRQYCSRTCSNKAAGDKRKEANMNRTDETKKAATTPSAKDATGDPTPEVEPVRFISSSHSLQFLEPHEEHRSKETGELQGYRRMLTGEVVKEIDLRKIRFGPKSIAVPKGIRAHEYQTVGVYVATEQWEIDMLRQAESDAQRKNDPERMMEYPEDEEHQLIAATRNVGNKDIREKHAMALQE